MHFTSTLKRESGLLTYKLCKPTLFLVANRLNSHNDDNDMTIFLLLLCQSIDLFKNPSMNRTEREKKKGKKKENSTFGDNDMKKIPRAIDV